MVDPRRRLPSVHQLADLVESRGDAPGDRRAIVAAARHVVDAARANTNGIAQSTSELVTEAVERLRGAARPSLRRVINATGVILQTNLGRAPLSDRALRAMAEVGAGYSNLEFDVASGSRGGRH